MFNFVQVQGRRKFQPEQVQGRRKFQPEEYIEYFED
jgi:hypothetical protein